MGIGSLIKGLSPATKRLLNFFEKGKRFAQRDIDEPMVRTGMGRPEGLNTPLTTRFPSKYYEGAPGDISFEDIERFKRAAQSGFTMPAWRGVKGWPDLEEIDPSFHTRGAHVDLSPSGISSRIWASQFGQPFSLSPEVTGLRPEDLRKELRLMSQVAVKPSRQPLFVTDEEANDPEMIAKILGYDPDELFRGVTELDIPGAGGGFDIEDKFYKERWKRALGKLQEEDIDLLYPNIGEVDKTRMGPLSRVSRANRADAWLGSPKETPFGEFMKGRDPFFTYKPHRFWETVPKSVRHEMASEMLVDPNELKMIGAPSYVVTDPSRMRDLGLAEFLDPYGKTIYKKRGGLASLS